MTPAPTCDPARPVCMAPTRGINGARARHRLPHRAGNGPFSNAAPRAAHRRREKSRRAGGGVALPSVVSQPRSVIDGPRGVGCVVRAARCEVLGEVRERSRKRGGVVNLPPEPRGAVARLSCYLFLRRRGQIR